MAEQLGGKIKGLGGAERLIVALDLAPQEEVGGRRKKLWVEFLRFIEKLRGTGVTVKVNSLVRALGYEAIDAIHYQRLSVMADLKLFDIPHILETDGKLLQEARPEFVTVMCGAGPEFVAALKRELPDTQVIGTTVVPSFSEDLASQMYGRSIQGASVYLAKLVDEHLDGFIVPARQAAFLRVALGEKKGYEISINVSNIRPSWCDVTGDEQNLDQAMTPTNAIVAGADRIIVDRPIVKAKDPHDAVRRIIAEIANALEKPSI